MTIVALSRVLAEVLASPPPTQIHSTHGLSCIPRGPTSYRTTASPSSSGWPQACSMWRKHPRYGEAEVHPHCTSPTSLTPKEALPQAKG